MADWAWILGPGPGLLEEGLMAAAAVRGRKRNRDLRYLADEEFPRGYLYAVFKYSGPVLKGGGPYLARVMVPGGGSFSVRSSFATAAGARTAALSEARVHYWSSSLKRPEFSNPADGIQLVLGITRHDHGPRGGVTQIQSVMFDKGLWTRERAAAWCKAHDLRSGDSESQANFWRFRQLDPADFEEFRVVRAGQSNPEIPKLVVDALERYRAEGNRGVDWADMHATQAERDAVDAWLVAQGHPLAMKAGTQETRLKAIVRELAGRGNPGFRPGVDKIEPGYRLRFIRPEHASELVNLYHLARVSKGTGAARHERMIWASDAFHKTHPEISATAAYKDLDGILTLGYTRPYPRAGKKPNPESDAAHLYEDFHGRPSTKIIDSVQEIHEPDELSGLGDLVEMKVATVTGLEATLSFKDDPPLLCASPSRRQLYLQDGDQGLDLASLKMNGKGWVRESMVIGVISELTYSTEKGFEKFVPRDFFHKLGEESGVQPLLLYDPASKLLAITGGTYQIKREGIVD